MTLGEFRELTKDLPDKSPLVQVHQDNYDNPPAGRDVMHIDVIAVWTPKLLTVGGWEPFGKLEAPVVVIADHKPVPKPTRNRAPRKKAPT